MLLRSLGYLGLSILVFVTAFLMLDPIELALGVTVFVVLLVVQLQFLVSKLKVKAATAPEVDASRVAGLLKEIQKAQSKPKQKNKASKPQKKTALPASQSSPQPSSQPSSQGSETLDSDLFSKFQKNLSQVGTEPGPEVEADDEVVVSLSSQKKNFKVKGVNPYAKAAGKAAGEQPTEDASSTKVEGGKKRAAKTGTKIKPAKLEAPQEGNLPATKTGPTSSPKVVGGSDASELSDVGEVGEVGEVSAKNAISSQSLKSTKELLQDVPTEPLGELFSDIEDEEHRPAGKMIQPKKRQKGISSKPPVEATEILTAADLELPDSTTLKLADQKIEDLKEEEPAVSKDLKNTETLPTAKEEESEQEAELEAFKVKAHAEFEQGKFAEHQKTYEQIFKRFILKTDPEFLPTLEKVMDQYIRAGQQQHAIHFLFTALKEYQTGGDLKRMDVTYYHIEEAYRALEDVESLVKTYQNHLAIKKQREDFIGQLPILDHLGKILYDQGDQQGSKQCYEQAVKIQQQEA